jgi:hypothetical protein
MYSYHPINFIQFTSSNRRLSDKYVGQAFTSPTFCKLPCLNPESENPIHHFLWLLKISQWYKIVAPTSASVIEFGKSCAWSNNAPSHISQDIDRWINIYLLIIQYEIIPKMKGYNINIQMLLGLLQRQIPLSTVGYFRHGMRFTLCIMISTHTTMEIFS